MRKEELRRMIEIIQAGDWLIASHYGVAVGHWACDRVFGKSREVGSADAHLLRNVKLAMASYLEENRTVCEETPNLVSR